MRKRRFSFLALIVPLLLLTGCLQLKPKDIFNTNKLFQRSSLEKDFFMGKYVSKVDNFIIILDTSSSMGVPYEGESYKGYSKLSVAKDFLGRMNNIVPEIKIGAAIQTFGNKATNQTETVYGLTKYSRSRLRECLSGINASVEGNSPAGIAIGATNQLLSTISGRNAIILISDGERLENNPLMKVRALKVKYGNRACFYSVWVGNKPGGRRVMERLVREMKCGFLTDVESTSSMEEMENFVKKVFLEASGGVKIDSDGDGVYDDVDRCPGTPVGVPVDVKGCPEAQEKPRIDSDGDGVYDDVDRCPGTPIGVPVDDKGCPLVQKKPRVDSDGDGVYDDVDRCPDTPMGVDVDVRGCAEIRRIDSDGDSVYDDVDVCPDTPVGAIADSRGCWVIKGVQFEYKKWDIPPQFTADLDNAVDVLTKNPSLKIMIVGHTDNIGSMEYNIDLSEKRANAIKEYFVENGISGSRITTTGVGFLQPVAPDDTPEGRALNRRAELIPAK
ncbi:MAG: OmpA family protein [Planctomycetes bacterium]|nr:OmpA family protein [Planctomycetota bacterium]